VNITLLAIVQMLKMILNNFEVVTLLAAVKRFTTSKATAAQVSNKDCCVFT
jgi:hypothetical protein